MDVSQTDADYDELAELTPAIEYHNEIQSSSDHQELETSGGDVVTFNVGDEFESFNDLDVKVHNFEQANSIKLWKRDCRTIVAARKRLDRHLDDKLNYYSIKFCCVHGGQKFRNQGKGLRNTWTMKQACPMFISLRANDAGTKLRVVSMNLDHNHEVSQALFKHLPQQRRLSNKEKEEAEKLLHLKANKKLVQEEMSRKTGKVILLKDLSNINSKRFQGDEKNNLDNVVATLRDKYGATVDVLSDEDSCFKGLFFQDPLMKHAFDAYPEIVFIDATYKLLDLGLPVYLMLAEDSNGQSEIICVCLLVSEDADSLKWMIETFKHHNSATDKTRVIMADKDIKERQVLKECLPHSSVLICLFHTLRSFRREIACEKLGITSGQRQSSLEIIQKMAYAATEEEYDILYNQLIKDCPKPVVQYFNENWHPIKEEWVLGMKCQCGSFLNMTNNRLEAINGKLKQVISRRSSLERFVEQFFVILNTLRTERDHRSALMFQKVKVIRFEKGSAESDYSNLLTAYSFEFVNKQLQLAKKVKRITAINNDQYTVTTSQGETVVSLQDCNCLFRVSMLLPCRHMFALRAELGKPIFDSNLCNERWTCQYYKSTQRLFLSSTCGADGSSDSSSLFVTSEKPKQRPLTQHAKYRKALHVSTELASIASTASGIHFERRLQLLQELSEHWRNGEEVMVAIARDAEDEELNDVIPPNPASSLSSPSLVLSAPSTTIMSPCTSSVVSPTPSALTTVSPPAVSPNVLTTVSSPAVSSSVTPVELHHTSTVSSSIPRASAAPSTVKLGLKVLPCIKQRGRPKGSDLTVIGLPRKRRRKDLKMPCSFVKLHASSKEKVILNWLVDEAVCEAALKGRLIEENEVESKPENVPNAVLDENVDITLVKKYFTSEAWMLVDQTQNLKRQNVRWSCHRCSCNLDEKSVCCEGCLNWYHFKCVGLIRKPKMKNWFCRQCYSDAS